MAIATEETAQGQSEIVSRLTVIASPLLLPGLIVVPDELAGAATPD